MKKEFYNTNLKGTLDLSDFVNLEKLAILNQADLEQVVGLENLSKLTCLVTADQQIQELRRQLFRKDQAKQTKEKELTHTQDLNAKLQADNRDLLKDIQNYKQKITTQNQAITDLSQELTQQKSLLTQHLTQEKAQLTKEITLIKEVLHA